MKECQFCKELIKEEAVVCRFCHKKQKVLFKPSSIAQKKKALKIVAFTYLACIIIMIITYLYAVLVVAN